MATPEAQRRQSRCAVTCNNTLLLLGGVSLWVSSYFLMQSGPHIHKKLVILYIITLLYQLWCVLESVCVCVECVQFSSIRLFLNGGGVLTCMKLCLTTIACTLKWQQAVFPWWSRSGRIQVGFNSCRFKQCPLQFRRLRNTTEHLTDTRLRFKSYDLLI